MSRLKRMFGATTAESVREEQLETSRDELRRSEAQFELARGALESAASSIAFHKARIARLEGSEVPLQHPSMRVVAGKGGA